MTSFFSRKTKVKTMKAGEAADGGGGTAATAAAAKTTLLQSPPTSSAAAGTSNTSGASAPASSKTLEPVSNSDVPPERRRSSTMRSLLMTRKFSAAQNNPNNFASTSKTIMMAAKKSSGVGYSHDPDEALDSPSELREGKNLPQAPTLGRRFRESTVMADPSQQYELVQEVGEGSYGKVYKARHKITNVVVAVKVIPVDNDLEELNKEITALKMVKNSDYIISYHGSFQADGGFVVGVRRN